LVERLKKTEANTPRLESTRPADLTCVIQLPQERQILRKLLVDKLEMKHEASAG
jgi:hypothetical protein